MDNSKKPRTGHTTDIVNTMEHMIDISSPMTARAATVHTIHTYIRHEIKEPLNTLDDVEFTKEELLAVIEKFDPGKAPGEDGQNSEILLKTFKRFPAFITGLYIECLRKGYFPKTVETFNNNSHNKTRKRRKCRNYEILTYQSS
jgi:hypothetical protein